ncbi:MAG: hypothetical protein HPY85_07980 [Anaerolineae bacterium]|nr:hypothetical protein [Anaerolineae bacterium]
MNLPHAKIWLPVLLVAILARLPWLITPSAVAFGDTQGYLQMANVLRNAFENGLVGGLPGNLGARPPIYSLFLLLCQMQGKCVIMIQATLGLVITAAILVLTWRLTHSTAATVILGLFPAMNLAQIFFERALLSEALASASLLLCAGLLGFFDPPGEVLSRWRWLAAGLLAAVCILTRTAFLYLVPVGVAVVWLQPQNGRKKATASVFFLLPLVVSLLGWSWINSLNTGQFTLSTITGYNLINHTGAWFEILPDEDAILRDIYLQYRSERLQESGTQSMTIWRALDPMMEASGLNYFSLSNELTRLSGKLIAQQPDKYLASVAKAWVGFWKVPIYWQLESIPNPLIRQLLQAIWWVERMLQIAANLVFLCLAGYFTYQATRRSLNGLQVKLCQSTLLILSASFLQALVELGENPRYGYPTQIIVMWVVVISMWDILTHRQQRSGFRSTGLSGGSGSGG